ncbi:protein CHAPERONE-LIKE PROTEIN OF POR1, chloroplastic isoform X2 [Primulina tabacum]|uniref:protein CHAPERONE-LIKE PROTEIN OF POR1, chloroplastic isoform X2 n=1 Tax=Primulina tabacum TaxID=48773 RepID=UPI003F5AAEC2
MVTALLVRPNHSLLACGPAGSYGPSPPTGRWPPSFPIIKAFKPDRRGSWGTLFTRRVLALPIQAGSRADDSASFEMSVENALKLLGVPEEASFEDILRAKNSLVAACKDDQQAISQLEAAYDMLLMKSLSQRRAGKVVDSNIRYADVKPVNAPKMDSMPKWLQSTVKNSPLSVEVPSTSDLGVQAGVYGALMVLTYVNGVSASSTAPYAGADVPGLILATSFGTSLYFMTKKNIKLGKKTYDIIH